ncbi:hypothetical protein AG1IA_04034 [Rhizoctonia solani AG-1 IA]|uniref:Uncharacterized protein n=1 Tax=Thanatephorus cucumeris (strain AG1-IA) TaxID=983506 RepID=L8WVA9_THACA|nr:hypothetical protein AG1IA_04034 [Rhizoctonia solani AG-1 IA]
MKLRCKRGSLDPAVWRHSPMDMVERCRAMVLANSRDATEHTGQIGGTGRNEENRDKKFILTCTRRIQLWAQTIADGVRLVHDTVGSCGLGPGYLLDFIYNSLYFGHWDSWAVGTERIIVRKRQTNNKQAPPDESWK